MLLVSLLGSMLVLVLIATWVWMRVRPPVVHIYKELDLDWYLDERSHTGDLIFFKRAGVDLLHRLVSPMTHVALVVMHPVSGEPWVVEMHDEKTVPGSRDGVHAYPARQRLGDTDECLFVVPIRRASNYQRIMDVVENVKDTPYPSHMRRKVATCKLAPWMPRTDRGMICSEFVAFLLDQTGILPGNWQCLTPSDLLGRATCSTAYQEPYALK